MNRTRGPFEQMDQVLPALREERHVKLEALQARCGIPGARLEAFETGEELPTLEELGAILDGLGVGARELGWRLDQAVRSTTGASQPPAELRKLVTDLTQAVAVALWFGSRPEGRDQEPPDELLAKASEAGRGMVEALWELFETVLLEEPTEEESS